MFPLAYALEGLVEAELTTKLKLLRALIVGLLLFGLANIVGGVIAGRPVFVVGGVLVIGFAIAATAIPGISSRRREFEKTRDEAARAEARRHLGHE